MRTKVKQMLAAIVVVAVLITSINAEPFYKSKEDYQNRVPAVQKMDRMVNPKSPANKESSSLAGEPDLDAEWAGASVWMSGISWSGAEAFGNSIGKGKYFFGSNVGDEDYVPVRIIFETGVPNQTLCQIFRRDLGYAAAGVGTFPGSAWDISDPDNPRRLNICFVEDNNSGVANAMWDPNGTGSPIFGKREYLYVMLSDYDGTGLTYAGFNGNVGASGMDILYNWWPLVAGGHTFFENEPCTLTIAPYYLKNFRCVPSDTICGLEWRYAGSATVDHFNVYGDGTNPPTTLLGQVSGAENRFTATGLTQGNTYYFKVEADDAARSIVGSSPIISADAVFPGSEMTVLDYWHGYGTYGDCWGYIDTVTDKEYALICARNDGVAIIDLSTSPISEVGFLPGNFPGDDIKDVKIYKNYAITISEYSPGQIFDISDPSNPVKVADILNITGDATNGAHNCMVDGDYLYVVGNHDIGGLEIWDISTPSSPVSVGTHQPFYYHDVDIYNDTLIAAGIYGDGLNLLDITNKTSPSFITTFNYSSSGAHNCEFIQGMDYVAIGDEIGGGPHTRIFDLQNLVSITKVADIEPDPAQPTHNCYVRNDTLFIAHYAMGLRMYDVSDPTNPVDAGYYDTYPAPVVGYVGAWNVYPYFPSGKIIISDMQTGLYVLEVAGGPPPTCCIGNRGDLNNDGDDANILDLTYCVDRIFRSGPPPSCFEEGDVNSDGDSANILDLTFLVDRIFRGGAAPGPC